MKPENSKNLKHNNSKNLKQFIDKVTQRNKKKKRKTRFYTQLIFPFLLVLYFLH